MSSWVHFVIMLTELQNWKTILKATLSPLAFPVYFALRSWLVFHSCWSPKPYRPSPARSVWNGSEFEKENKLKLENRSFQVGHTSYEQSFKKFRIRLQLSLSKCRGAPKKIDCRCQLMNLNGVNGTYFIHMKNQIKFADVLKAFVQRFDEDLKIEFRRLERFESFK